jgi:hypothetical protein
MVIFRDLALVAMRSILLVFHTLDLNFVFGIVSQGSDIDVVSGVH